MLQSIKDFFGIGRRWIGLLDIYYHHLGWEVRLVDHTAPVFYNGLLYKPTNYQIVARRLLSTTSQDGYHVDLLVDPRNTDPKLAPGPASGYLRVVNEKKLHEIGMETSLSINVVFTV